METFYVPFAQISLVEYSSIRKETYSTVSVAREWFFSFRSQADAHYSSRHGNPKIQKYGNHISDLPVTCRACKSITINVHIWVNWPITASLSSIKNIFKRLSYSCNRTPTSVYWVIVHARVCRYSLHARDNLDQWKCSFREIVSEG